MWIRSLVSLLLLAASQVSAQAGFCQSSLGLCMVLSIPERAAESESGSITFNVTAPSSGWSAVGLGPDMQGSLVFMMWAAGDRVVVSPRIAEGESQPSYYAGAGVRVLDGSRVDGDTMTAVFTCSNCWSWSSDSLQVSSNRRPWIYAQNTRQDITTTNPSANLFQHVNRGTTSVDMTRAVVKSSSSSSGNPATGTTIPAITNDQNLSVGLTKREKVLIAHATLMSVAFLFLFPLGVSIIRFLANFVPNPVWSHAGFQIFAWCVVVVGFGLGYWLSDIMNDHFNHTHQKFGITIVFLFVLQIAFGLWHHAYFKSHRRRGVPSHLHLWFGRALMICGIVNGGLGLSLEGDTPRPWTIAYAVVAAVVGINLILGVGLKELSRARSNGQRKGTPNS